MSKGKIVLTVFSAFFLVGALVSTFFYYINNSSIEYFKAKGEVTKIEWNSKNHGQPLIEITNGFQSRYFSHGRIALLPGQIKVGDNFRKESGSKTCLINNAPVICIK